MKKVLQHIREKTEIFSQKSLFGYLADDRIPAGDRLQFAPCMAHFVFSFMDINRFLLPDMQDDSEYQKLVNIHASEDAWHWPWYLHDLQQMNMDPVLPVSDVLRFLWGESTRASRLLSYRCVSMIAGASSVQKLAIVETIEMTGKVFLECTAALCAAWPDAPGKLLYFGQNHADCETGHHMGTAGIMHYLESIKLDAAEREECLVLVDELFMLYGNFVDEMLAFAENMNSDAEGRFAVIGALQDERRGKPR